MHIFFLNSVREGSWGGGEKWMLTAGIGLRKKGHAVSFGGRRGSLFLERCAGGGFPILELRVGGDVGPFTIAKLARFFKDQHIDVIIANFTKDVRLAGLARRLSGVAALVARNGLPLLRDNHRTRLTMKHLASGILTNTRSIKERYLSYGWLDEGFVRVIHNGIDTAERMDFPREQMIAKYGLPDNRPVIGIFGRLVTLKGHRAFLEVAKEIARVHPGAMFLIVGGGPERHEIERCAVDLWIRDQVVLLGMQREVFELYSLCDLVLLTSSSEGLPNVVMEAMLAGRAVVAFDVGGVRELISSPESGVVVAAGDTASMARESLVLLGSNEKRLAMGRAARNHIMAHFPLEKMVTELESYLEELVSSSPLS
jgi:glycosyltransferase involved in cell wall biosynthesis